MTALRLLLFRSGGQVWAVEAGAVREIIPASQATRIPGTPDAVLGLINVRGMLVPVVDTSSAAGIGPGNSAGSVILVERRGRIAGLAVDEVLDLATVAAEMLDRQAALPGVRPDLVRAVGTAGGQSFVHLSTDVLLEPLLP